MSDGTSIEWTDATVNAINGCSLASPGCTNCYAMKQAHRVEARRGLTVQSAGGMVWTGDVRFNAKAMLQPLSWRRPRKIFWNAHGDTFHEKVPDEWIDKCFAVMALTPHHVHQVLTKRSGRMHKYIVEQHRGRPAPRVAQEAHKLWKAHLQERGGSGYLAIPGSEFDTPNLICWPLPNVWLGVSVEDQKRADERVPDLLATPAAVRWLSMEPLLGPVDLTSICTGWHFINSVDGFRYHDPIDENVQSALEKCPRLDWVVLGGESGHKARPMHPDWVRSVRDQCAAAGVPFHFKQHGSWRPFLGWKDGVSRYADESGSYGPELIHRFDDGKHAVRVGKKAAGRLLDGVEHNGFPEVPHVG